MKKATVLIVDDELMVRRLLGYALTRSGYQVELASNGVEATERLARPGIDLLLIDLQLGDMDGVQVMQVARQSWPNLPIIMLTAHGSLNSAIAAVRCGAADYLLKPISIENLRARVAAVLEESHNTLARRAQLLLMYDQMKALLQSEGMLQQVAASVSAGDPTIYESGPLRLDVQQHTVSMNGQGVDATPSEFMILLGLLSQPGTVVSCLQLARTICSVNDEEEARQIIRPHIVRLRRKLELDPQQPCYLVSVRGIGYRWIGEPETDSTTLQAMVV